MHFRDLNKQYLHLKEEIDFSIAQVTSSGDFIHGKAVKTLELELAEYVGTNHCISCANGTDALTLALKTWNIQKGDAVFVPDFTFFATSEVVSLEGALPVFVDVDSETFNIDPNDLEIKICKIINDAKYIPKVIISVDLFGLPANYPKIIEIAKKYGLYILEDSAQGFGGNINNKRNCSFGDISTTSFFPAKPLGCYGDGGAIFTDNNEWASHMKSLREHGKGEYKYDNINIGMNSRLDTIQAAILSVKLRAFNNFELERVNEISKLYSSQLKDYVGTPLIPNDYMSSWAQYTIRLDSSEERNNLKIFLEDNNIPSMIYYPKTLSNQTVYKNISIDNNVNPVAQKLSETVLSLPMHPYLTDEDAELVINTIKKFFINRN